MCYSKMCKTNTRNLQVACNPTVHRTQPHNTIRHTTAVCYSLHISKRMPLSCVTPRRQPYQGVIPELSPMRASAEWCWHLFWRRRKRAVKLQYKFIFPSGRTPFCAVKREVQIRSEGWVASRSAKLTPFCARLIFGWGKWSGSTAFIISLWGELTIILLC